MGPRGAGRRLNDQERMEILDILSREAKVKNVDLAKRYGVSEGAIRKLKQIKDTIRDRYVMGNEQNRDKRKRGGFVRNAKFEQELYEWICRMRESQAYQLIPLTQTAVRQQAMLLAKNYETMATFKASPGWFARFCSRHRLDPPVHHGSTAGGDSSTTAGLVLGTTAAVGDTVPGGPLASAYQVDALAVGAASVPVAAAGSSFTDQVVDAASVVKGSADVDMSCAEALDEQAQAQLAAAAAAATAAVAAADVSIVAVIPESTPLVAPASAGANDVDVKEPKTELFKDEPAKTVNPPVALDLKPTTGSPASAPASELGAGSAPTPTPAAAPTASEEEIFSLGL